VTARDASIDRWLRALAQRELSIPGRYQLSVASPAPVRDPWWTPAWRWLADRWELWKAIWAHVHVTPNGARGIGDALLAAIGLLLLYVAIRLVSRIRFARESQTAMAEPLGAPPDPAAFYREACEAAGRGDYGNAALLLFAATVALLDLRGVIAGKRSATVGDLRRELRAGHATLVPAFDAVAAPFVEKAYAERAVAAPQWQRARTGYDALRQAQGDMGES
jgi:hypothetical protein